MRDGNDLERVIKVDTPLEPEKGGYYKAYKENYFYDPEAYYRKYDPKKELLGEPFFHDGLKQEIPLLNLANGSFSSIDLIAASTVKHNVCPDFRALDFHLIKALGLGFKYKYTEEELTAGFSLALHGDDHPSSYKRQSIKHGFLVSLDELNDKEFISALNTAAKANSAEQPKFDDAKYKPQFKKLEQCLNQLNLLLKYLPRNTYDYDHAIFKHSGNLAPKWSKTFTNNIKLEMNFKGVTLASLPNINVSIYSYNRNILGNTVVLAPPIQYRSENDFLKAGAHALTNFHINTNFSKFLKDPNELAIRDIAGTMFAAHLGVPLTQNEINRFGCYFRSREFPEHHSQIFKQAEKVVTSLLELTLKKENKVIILNNQGLWNTWKRAHKDYALQMATPSLERLCKENNIALSRDNVIDYLNKTTAFKINSFAVNKEQLKGSITNKEVLENKANDLKKVVTVSINQPQEKLTNRPKEPDNTVAFDLIPQIVRTNKGKDR